MELLESFFSPCDAPLALWSGVAFGLLLVAVFLAIVLSGRGRGAWGTVLAIAAVVAVLLALRIVDAMETRRACWEDVRHAEERLPVTTGLVGYYTGWVAIDGAEDYVHLWLEAPSDGLEPGAEYAYRLRRGTQGQEGIALLDVTTGLLFLEGLGELAATEGPDGVVRLGREEPAARLEKKE